MFEKIVSNPICWCILLLALFVYQLIFHDLLHLKQYQAQRKGYWQEVSSILTAALPLLGLLGTIVGLLDMNRGYNSTMAVVLDCGDELRERKNAASNLEASGEWFMRTYSGHNGL